ncbi:MAG: D-Ala-D-Ala carboxypeptidase family metallohydrolase [Faecousia sp.]
MTDKQKQCLLVYLGYDTGGVDGIWGDKSRLATLDFQRDYSLEPDGVFGDGTAQRIREVIATGEKPGSQPQEDSGYVPDAAKYLKSDGYYHIPRGVDVQLSKNLWAHEIHCCGKGCCTESVVSKRIVDLFQKIRDAYGDSITITTAGGSGYRCRTHNSKVGGANTSLHLTGDALDLHCRYKARLLSVVETLVTDGEIGIYRWGIHVGVWNRGYVNRFSN